MNDAIAELRASFEATFGAGGTIQFIRAPGRVNLIGEHTDYNEGFVFPMAIEPEVRVACRQRDDNRVRVASTAYGGQMAEFALAGRIERGEPPWANYCRGVAAMLLAAGLPLCGADALITNTLPPGGGLSSSAAIEAAFARALLTLAGVDIDAGRLALLCQKAEHEYAGTPCGIMDQTIIISGRAAHAMLLDCRDLSRQHIPLDGQELRVVIADTRVPRNLAGSEYGVRRRQCEQAVEFFRKSNPAVRALRDVTMRQIDDARGRLDDVLWRRAKHVVSENARTTQAAVLLGRREYEQVGRLMLESHASLRDDYQVSCAELDLLVEESMKVKGVYGARMTGGGFGGCMVALAQPRSVETLRVRLCEKYEARFGRRPDVFVTTATDGAGRLA